MSAPPPTITMTSPSPIESATLGMVLSMTVGVMLTYIISRKFRTYLASQIDILCLLFLGALKLFMLVVHTIMSKISHILERAESLVVSRQESRKEQDMIITRQHRSSSHGITIDPNKPTSEIGDVQQRYMDPFLVAIQGGKMDDFKRELSKAGFERMDQVDKAGATPLLYAQLISKNDLVRSILSNQDYPLHIRLKWLTTQYHLPSNNPNEPNKIMSAYEGENILHIAIVQKNESQVDYFLTEFEQYGAQVDHVDPVTNQVIKLTVRQKLLRAMAVGRFFQPREEMWDEFGKRTARIARSPDHLYFGGSPLAFALCTNQLNLVQKLVKQYGAAIDVADSHGNNLLHLTVMHELPQAYMEILLLCGDRVDRFLGLVSTMTEPLWKRVNNKGLTPLCLAANLGLTQMFKYQMDLRRLFHWEYASITAWAYDLEELLKPNGAVAQIVQRENTQLVDDPLIECLLGLQWERGLGNIFFRQMRKTLFAIFVLTTTSVVAFAFPFVRLWELPDPMKEPYSFLLYVGYTAGNMLLFVAASGKLQTELGEMTRKGRFYLAGSRTQVFENVISTSTSVLTLSLILVRQVEQVMDADDFDRDYYEHLLAASSNLLAWFYSLFFLLGFEDSGQFVVMLWRMLMRDVAVFSGVFSVFLFGFSSSFFHLNTSADKTVALTWHNYSQHLENSFSTMLGNYDLEEFRDGEYSIVATSLYLLYTILCTVLLFNVLIARMTNTIETIQSSSRNLWIIERARIMQSIADEYAGGWDELVEKRLVDVFWINIRGKKYMEVHIEDPSYFENHGDERDGESSHVSLAGAGAAAAATVPPQQGKAAHEATGNGRELQDERGRLALTPVLPHGSSTSGKLVGTSQSGGSFRLNPRSIVVDGVRYFQSSELLEQERLDERSRISIRSQLRGPVVSGGMSDGGGGVSSSSSPGPSRVNRKTTNGGSGWWWKNNSGG